MKSMEFCQICKSSKLNKIYHHVTWSLNFLYEDKYPSSGPNGEELVGKQKDRAGQSICGGLKFSLTEIRGDWLYHKQVFRFRSSWKGGTNLPVCFQCPAMASGVNRYYHVDASTPLWSKQYNLIQFLVQQLPETEVCVQTIDQYTL